MVRFDRTIPPGGEGGITLRINTAGDQGRVSRGANVYSDDPSHPVETLAMSFLVRLAVQVAPDHVFFNGTEGQKITKIVRVNSGLDKPLILEPTYFNLDKKLTYRVEEINKGKNYKIHFTNIPGPADSFYGFLKLKTNYSEKPEIKIPIRAKFNVKPAIDLLPNFLYMKGLAGQTITRTVTVRAGRDKPLTLEAADFDLDTKLKYSIEEVEAGKNFKIHFTSIPGPAEYYSGLLKLKTNYLDKPLITIPIKGRFRN